MWQCFEYRELGSTNDRAYELSKAAGGKKFAVVADVQTGGRGRRGRRWVGEEGNLFFTLALPFDIQKSGVLVLVSGLALLKAIRSLKPDADVVVKWPNDVLLNGKKISGILLEKAEAEYMLVGIGVNIAVVPQVDAGYSVGSLASAGIKIDRKSFMRLYLDFFDALLGEWAKKGMAELVGQWMQNAAGLGRPVTVRMPKETKNGIFAGLDQTGMMILQTTSGEETISAGDVFFDEESKSKDDR